MEKVWRHLADRWRNERLEKITFLINNMQIICKRDKMKTMLTGLLLLASGITFSQTSAIAKTIKLKYYGLEVHRLS